MVVQISSNTGQTTSLALRNMRTSNLGVGVENLSILQSLAEIDAQADAKASFQKIMPEPGMFNCEKCGSDLVQHTTAQIMRADEAETVFLTCFNCDHKWALDRGF